jgi:hypothetical protein
MVEVLDATAKYAMQAAWYRVIHARFSLPPRNTPGSSAILA